MPHSLTFTGKTGPGNTVTSVSATSQVGEIINQIHFDFDKKIITVNTNKGVKEFDLAGITSIVDTITGVNHALVIS